MRTYKKKRDTGIGGYVVSLTPTVLDTGQTVVVEGAEVGDLVLFGAGGSATDLVSGTPTLIKAVNAGLWRKMNTGTYMSLQGAGVGGIIDAVTDNGGDNYTVGLDSEVDVTVDLGAEPSVGELLLFGTDGVETIQNSTPAVIPTTQMAYWNSGLGLPAGWTEPEVAAAVVTGAFFDAGPFNATTALAFPVTATHPALIDDVLNVYVGNTAVAQFSVYGLLLEEAAEIDGLDVGLKLSTNGVIGGWAANAQMSRYSIWTSSDNSLWTMQKVGSKMDLDDTAGVTAWGQVLFDAPVECTGVLVACFDPDNYASSWSNISATPFQIAELALSSV